MKKIIKLDLGCGSTPMRVRKGPDYDEFRDYVTLDIIDYKPRAPDAVDIVADAAEHIPLENESVEAIICVEVLEHIPHAKTDKFMAEIYRVMTKGGKIRLQCPDFEMAGKSFLDKNSDERVKLKCLHCITGGQSHEYDVHRNIFTRDKLIDLFKKYGFKNIKELVRKKIAYPEPGWDYKYHLEMEAWK